MIDKKLIEQIVMEVIQALDGVCNAPSKRKLLLIGDKGGLVHSLLEKAECDWSIITDEIADVKKMDHILIVNASQDLIVKGALGMADTPQSEQLAMSLLAGKKISIIPEPDVGSCLFQKNPQNRYVKRLQDYMKQLEEYGAKVETLDSFVRQRDTKQPQEATRTAGKKKLLTQRDVQDCKGADITVCHDTIITPSARDAAKELGVRIIVAGQRS